MTDELRVMQYVRDMFKITELLDPQSNQETDEAATRLLSN
jgi:hypothetical protein